MEGEWGSPLQSPRVTKNQNHNEKNIYIWEGEGWGGVLESWFREGEMGERKKKRGGGEGEGGWWEGGEGGGGGSWITLGTYCCCCCCCANPIHLVNI